MSPVMRQAVVPPEEPASLVAVDLAIEDGVASGHLGWASSCRRVVLIHERGQKVVRRKPDYEAAVLAGITGIAAGVAGGALLDRRDEFSPEVTCEEDCDGNIACSSPRDDVTGWGISLVGSAIALTTAAIVTATSRSSAKFSSVDVGSTRQTRVLAEGVPCGEGPIAWLGVALYRADERVATSTSDGDGNVAFNVPAGLTGPVRLVADSDSTRYGLIAPGQQLGQIVLEPSANPIAP